jgi:hypothetical protein
MLLKMVQPSTTVLSMPSSTRLAFMKAGDKPKGDVQQLQEVVINNCPLLSINCFCNGQCIFLSHAQLVYKECSNRQEEGHFRFHTSALKLFWNLTEEENKVSCRVWLMAYALLEETDGAMLGAAAADCVFGFNQD